MYFDIHSHILHNTDDGARNLDTSIKLLEESYNQGVTDIIATPHFYPLNDVLEEYIPRVEKNFSELKNKVCNKNVPNIYLGYEVFYYSSISRAEALKELTLNGSKYILLEPNFYNLDKYFLNELFKIKENGFIPIIAHIERYCKILGYKKILNFYKENDILTQVNASSFFDKHYNRVLEYLLDENLITFIASDTHSMDTRPPMIMPALNKIEYLKGEEYKQKLVDNSINLLHEITDKDADL